MKVFQFISNNEKETKNFAKLLAKQLEKKDTIVLTGNLGSGKTKFVEGILSHFGLENEISSPTFTIDVYRLEDSTEFYEIGGEEYFEKGICLIEWGELIKDVLPKNYLHLTFSRNAQDENLRILNIETNSKKWEDYFENIKY